MAGVVWLVEAMVGAAIVTVVVVVVVVGVVVDSARVAVVHNYMAGRP